MKMLFLLLCLSGCATTNQLTFEEQVIDENDSIVSMECTLKNSIPSIHDEIL